MVRTGDGVTVMVLLACSAVLLLAACVEAAPSSDWSVHHAHRAIYARDTQVVRHQTVFEVTRKETAVFRAALMPDHLVLVTSFASTTEDPHATEIEKVRLDVGEPSIEEYRGVEYAVYDVDTSAMETKRFFLIVESYYAGAQTPFPAAIPQGSAQYTLYSDSSMIPSAYPIDEQTTSVYASFFEEYDAADPATINQHGQAEQELALGPYRNTRSWKSPALDLHIGNSAGFLVAKQTREVEASHWGNVAVEEHFDLENKGAKLKGQFSRLNYMHGAHGNSVNSITQYLPIGATEAYYRDQIGNISSSHMFTHREGIVKLDITPRFMLFGGWKIDWLSGYNLPSASYLSQNDAGSYVLSIPFTSGLVDTFVEELQYSVVLPEGAYDVQVVSPYPISDVAYSLRPTYLDTTGRVVASFSAKNIIAEHNDVLFVTYNVPTGTLYREPLMLVAGFFAVFLAAILYFRCDMSITPASN
eukprot:CAMPEP_0114627758 /NCGR_PEP_ID=MMETSP0168-20121206/12465_1 /TAXON_ID=95228 ORGANISM="Vannella sp., Strain DIVA3 517/6/12" /NCGR_SAMPLE_ID=MMETSP0168 /ASSEMBLY_ACC=CAM_ASM_000044 /LENGTH=471 /DNA_ID=CAMNT_0001839109 /DNA_START=14 /DNA_END=1429 /DNA_ORIENTATION=-